MVLSKHTHRVHGNRNPFLNKASSMQLAGTVLHLLGGDRILRQLSASSGYIKVPLRSPRSGPLTCPAPQATSTRSPSLKIVRMFPAPRNRRCLPLALSHSPAPQGTSAPCCECWGLPALSVGLGAPGPPFSPWPAGSAGGRWRHAGLSRSRGSGHAGDPGAEEAGR